jgi:hypothetical protein
MTRTWLIRIVAPLVVGAMLLGACGGDDGTTSAADGTTDTATDGGDDGAGIFDAAECAEAVTAWSSAAAAGVAMGQGAGDMGSSVEQLQAFAASAPEEIRADLTTVYEAYAAFVAALEGSGYDPTSGAIPTEEQIAAIEEASQSLDDAGVQEASDRVSAWFDANCST